MFINLDNYVEKEKIAVFAADLEKAKTLAKNILNINNELGMIAKENKDLIETFVTQIRLFGLEEIEQSHVRGCSFERVFISDHIYDDLEDNFLFSLIPMIITSHGDVYDNIIRINLEIIDNNAE